MKHYYLEETISQLMDESCETREEAIEAVEQYFNSLPKEVVLELLIRGQVHAREDERTNGQYDF